MTTRCRSISGSALTVGRMTRPRPGHADLSGAIKYQHDDVRNVLERASARETAIRCAVGACAKVLLEEFSIKIVSHVAQIGSVVSRLSDPDPRAIAARSEESPVRMLDHAAEKKAIRLITQAKKAGDTLGGILEVLVFNAPVGLGSHVHWEDKLDANLARALMSIQAMKGVEIGLGFNASKLPGSQVHDEIFYDAKAKSFTRKTNGAGGIEGGMSNGQPMVMRVAMKPLATLIKPLNSVDIITKIESKAGVERSDVCAVPPAAVVCEAVVAIEIAREMLRKFGGDSLVEMKRNFKNYSKQVSEF